MKEGEIAVGDIVRYPNTGTTGRVIALEKIPPEGTGVGGIYATLDSTGLRYRIDTLIRADAVAEKKVHGEFSDLDRLRRAEDMNAKDISDAFDNVNGVGAG
ncbi:MAG: DUF2098 domain-containing protein [Methanomicrobium sp.]|nr:DUF2098 domain-containing protein [Methanomicrobium sp.]